MSTVFRTLEGCDEYVGEGGGGHESRYSQNTHTGRKLSDGNISVL